MRCIHCVGRISASSVSSRPFSNSFLPLHVAEGCHTPSAISVGHPGGEFISFECGKGDQSDLPCLGVRSFLRDEELLLTNQDGCAAITLEVMQDALFGKASSDFDMTLLVPQFPLSINHSQVSAPLLSLESVCLGAGQGSLAQYSNKSVLVGPVYHSFCILQIATKSLSKQ